ncbi:glycoside hydrolase family 2 protein [Sphaerisporangium album]|uniref:beta-mannosidase n=1 Tax=Sphaerisporangium album TaxID=509200 RepID=A0A367FJL9_9ACTN|nr:glycoside hydrolase family 2 protein [Sphaerisporangium album]RCG29907.1 glycoside hydrolase family 2 protein [Sphaerisporangium album]
MTTSRTLHAGWTLTALSDEVSIAGVPAQVPGCVHTDLLAAGLIEDPYLDDNENRLGWIGRTRWAYETTFAWAPDGHEHTDLVCEGLDTVATVILNGAQVARTANQHRSHRFPVRHLLAEGDNTLTVVFDSAYDYAEARRAAVGDRPGAYEEPYQFIRKMACNFGWDWGPTLVTAGIWRPIALESWSGARLAEVRPLVTAHAEDGRPAEGRVEVHVRITPEARGPVTVTAEVAGQVARAEVPAGQDRAVLVVTVPEPALWWPRGYGDQARHRLTVTLGDQEWSRMIGFRSVELDTEAFRLVINGRPVFARGVNWIPADCFPTRITRELLAERLAQAVDANVNLLRVWGGGLYESEDFYDLADTLGLLVWQDFPFACAAYPEEEPFHGEVEAEARQNVTRLTPHPSLVLWCGNNENIEGHADWGWRETLGDRTWGAGFYYDLLPAIVAELDPTRPYWPGSPYSGAPGLPPNDPARGTVHIWDVWNREDYRHYTTYRPRFVAEFGFQGPPAYATMRRAISGELASDAPLVLHHQKALDGNGKLLRGLNGHLPTPSTFDDWHYLTQLNQARAITCGIEHFRAQMPHCMGTILWQLNDCWPVTSWAAVDGDGHRKPLWHALRRLYADRLLVLTGETVTVVNDTDRPWHGELEIVRRSLTGEPLAKETVTTTTPARATTRVHLPPTVSTPTDPAAELLTARLDDHRTIAFYTEDTHVRFPEARYDATAERTGDGYTLTVRAHTLLRDLALFPDRLHAGASVDDMLLTLLPGETATFHITTAHDLDTDALTGPPVLRMVNEARH